MPEQERPSRKPNRLHSYDYSSIGTYFITICTIGRQPLLWNSTVGALTERPRIQLSAYGEIADNAIHAITQHYPAVSVDRYTIMSDHIHLLLE